MRIEENTFLVAGGGSGLGEATARMLTASWSPIYKAKLLKVAALSIPTSPTMAAYGQP